MLNIKNVEKRCGAQVVLDSIDCQIAPKERVIILGQNGAGKTTLLRCILGLYRPDKGEVLIGNLSAIKNRKEFLSRTLTIPSVGHTLEVILTLFNSNPSFVFPPLLIFHPEGVLHS